MPYTTDELKDPLSKVFTFYNALITKDESEYLEKIQKRINSGDITGGVLRDTNGGRIILFENIIPGQGTDGSSYPQHHNISIEDNGYFKYDDSVEISKIIDREFTELL